MTVQVNLLPAEYVLRSRRPRRLRLWAVLGAALVVALLMSGMVLRLKASSTRSALQQIAQMQAEQQALIKELAAVSAKRQALLKQVALSDRLRQKHRWSQVIAALTSRLPDNVVLTRLESDPPRDLPAAKKMNVGANLVQPLKASAEPPSTGGTAHGLLIEGVAANHELIADLLGALDDRSRFGTCELKSTSRQQFMDDYAVAFKIVTHWQ